ncbi:hypothetical protein EJ07DRAFT_173792 [Lizonia empirigonia]|nr:hypothetical protein EJ07DRAFT_173792 [Lizonia empirigonia]
MSFIKHKLSVDTLDAPEFPNYLPIGTRVNVPFPINHHPAYTTYPWAGVDIPDTFDNLISLPNPRLEPALYAAAVDTIRQTNWYFEVVGQYRKTGRPLTVKLVLQKERELRKKHRDASGNTVRRWPIDLYPNPPDLRTLFVKEAMGDPTNDRLPSLWVRACEDFHKMSDATIERYLSSTLADLQRESQFKTDNVSWLTRELFRRYLAWTYLVTELQVNKQPTRAQMEEFFARDKVAANGATLAEICCAFPYARKIEMLVYRVEQFATLEPQPFARTKAGAEDPVESRYIRRRVPSEMEVKVTVTRHLAAKESSVSFPELLMQYWPNSGNQQIIADVLVTIARPDVTTKRFILMSHEGPDADEISSVLSDLDGLTLRDIAGCFPNRVWSLDQLAGNIDGSEFAYFDEKEQRYFPLYESESTDHESIVKESMLHRTKLRIAKSWNADNIEEEYKWDVPTQRYVKRAEQSQPGHINPTFYPLPSQILLGRTPPPEPEKPQSTLQSGVVAAVQSTPIAPTAAPPVEAAAGLKGTPSPPGAPAPAAESPLKAGRGKNRAAEEASDGPKGQKKARITPAKIRCSQNTQKGTQCKKTKDRADGEEDWDCGVHKRAYFCL